jgi:hypothetical protein
LAKGQLAILSPCHLYAFGCFSSYKSLVCSCVCGFDRRIQSVFELSDGSGMAVTVARYETPAHVNIDKVGITPDEGLPSAFPMDEDSFCHSLQDPSSALLASFDMLLKR